MDITQLTERPFNTDYGIQSTEYCQHSSALQLQSRPNFWISFQLVVRLAKTDAFSLSALARLALACPGLALGLEADCGLVSSRRGRRTARQSRVRWRRNSQPYEGQFFRRLQHNPEADKTPRSDWLMDPCRYGERTRAPLERQGPKRQ